MDKPQSMMKSVASGVILAVLVLGLLAGALAFLVVQRQRTAEWNAYIERANRGYSGPGDDLYRLEDLQRYHGSTGG